MPYQMWVRVYATIQITFRAGQLDPLKMVFEIVIVSSIVNISYFQDVANMGPLTYS